MCIALSAGAIVGLVGTGVSLYSSEKQADAAEATAPYNAQIRRNRAQQIRERGNEKENAILAKAQALASRQRAQYAARNIDVNQGTPSLIQEQTHEEGVADAMRVQENTDDAYNAQMEGARMTLINGKNSARLARLRGIAGAFRSGMNLRRGYESAFGNPDDALVTPTSSGVGGPLALGPR